VHDVMDVHLMSRQEGNVIDILDQAKIRMYKQSKS